MTAVSQASLRNVVDLTLVALYIAVATCSSPFRSSS